jgi:hypothetical protein
MNTATVVLKASLSSKQPVIKAIVIRWQNAPHIHELCCMMMDGMVALDHKEERER